MTGKHPRPVLRAVLCASRDDRLDSLWGDMAWFRRELPHRDASRTVVADLWFEGPLDNDDWGVRDFLAFSVS